MEEQIMEEKPFIQEEQTMTYQTRVGNRQQKRKRQRMLIKQLEILYKKRPKELDETNEEELKAMKQWIDEFGILSESLANTGYKFGE